MGYFIAAIILWFIVGAFKRAVAAAKQAQDLQQQHSPTGSHTTITARRTDNPLDAGALNPRETGITDHKGPFLQIRQ